MSLNNLVNSHRIKRFLRKPQNLFLVIALLFGSALTFITPPLQIPDEFEHFSRAYQLAQGQLFSIHNEELGTGLGSVGGQIPLSMLEFKQKYQPILDTEKFKVSVDDLLVNLHIPLEPGKTAFTPISGFNYSPVPYIGSITVAFIGQHTNMAPILMMYLGRLFNLVVAIVLIYLAIRMTPVFKQGLLVLAVMPMVIFQLGSLSADSIGIGIAFLTIATVFKFTFSKEVKIIGQTEIVQMIILFAAMGLWKQAYAPFALLFFLIPLAKVGNRKKYLGLGLCVMIVSVLPMLLWSIANTPIINAATVPSNQFGSILTNPLSFIKTLFTTYYATLGQGYFTQAIGVFGWLNVPMSFLFHTIPYFILITLVALYENRRLVINLHNRAVLLLTSLGVIGLLSLSLYLIWTPPGSTSIEGLQGRYFIPIIPLLIILLSTRKLTLNIGFKRPKLLLSLALLFSCLLVVMRLITFYYV